MMAAAIFDILKQKFGSTLLVSCLQRFGSELQNIDELKSKKTDLVLSIWSLENNNLLDKVKGTDKVLQKRQSISINRQDVSTSIKTQMDSLIPPSKISGLTQGMFVGSVSNNFTERIEQKIFHAEIVVDTEKVKREESHYQPIPIINDFKDADGNDCMKQAIQGNYNQIKEDVKQIVKDELERIADDENLKHLVQK